MRSRSNPYRYRSGGGSAHPASKLPEGYRTVNSKARIGLTILDAEPPDSPERRLLYAVLLLAIRDATSYRRSSEESIKQRAEAFEWVFEEPVEPLRPMSCRWLCELLGVPFSKVAAVVASGRTVIHKYFH